MIEKIGQDYLAAGLEPEFVGLIKRLVATYCRDSYDLCVELPVRLEKLLDSHPLDGSETMAKIVKALPSGAEAPNNYIVYRALSRLVAVKLPPESLRNLLFLSSVITAELKEPPYRAEPMAELITEWVIGSMGSLHPATAQIPAVKVFLNTPFLVDYPEALGELLVWMR